MILSTTRAGAARPERRRAPLERRARRGNSPRDRARGRLDRLRALHGARALRAGARLLQRAAARSSVRPAISSRRRSSAARSAARSRLTLDAELDALGAHDVVELGAGSGALAAQLLETFAELGRDVRYRILEPSADLRERQQRALAPFADRVQWLDRLPETPFRGVVVANEVLDALPVSRFAIACRRAAEPRRRRGRRWRCAGEPGRALPEIDGGRARDRARACACAAGRLSLRGLPLVAGLVPCARGEHRARLAAVRRLRPRPLGLLPRAARRRHAGVSLPPSRPRRPVPVSGAARHHGVGRLQRLRRSRGGGRLRRRRFHDARAVSRERACGAAARGRT